MAIFGRAYAVRNGLNIEDPATRFIVLSDLLFHPLVTGFLYAALLALDMSTLSSQLLVSSSYLVEACNRLFMNKHPISRQHVNTARIRAEAGGIMAPIIDAR